jgi:hypothetical protein
MLQGLTGIMSGHLYWYLDQVYPVRSKSTSLCLLKSPSGVDKGIPF